MWIKLFDKNTNYWIAAHSTRARKDDQKNSTLYTQKIVLLTLTLSLPFTCFALTLEEANKQLNNANQLFVAGNIEKAFASYNTLHNLFPHSIALLQNTARAAYELNNNAYAISLLEKALKRQPDNPELHYQYAISLLTAGDYINGWYEYEWRWKKNDKQHIQFDYPQWRGEPTANKRLLLISEGDYGDIFQFVRFTKTLKKNGAHITLYTKKELIPLMRQQPYIDTVVSTLPPSHAIDYWISLMSVPAIVCKSESTLSADMPYITIDADAITRNKQYINQHTLNIGICWQADASNDANRPPLARRSIDDNLFDLFLLPGVTLYPLQKKHYDTDFDVVHGSFVDTAGLMHHLDLIITVDTAIAHLAGALGKQTWVLLPYKSDWRWMLERNDTPWYPTMTLFRNDSTTDWQSLCTDVAQTLAELLESKK